jgi:VCBS repeat-containing protein
MNMAAKLSTRKNWTLLLLASAAGLIGCVPNKTVTLQTNPLGGTFTILKIVNGQPGDPVTVAAPDPVTKITTQKLEFPTENTPVYTATGHLYQDGDDFYLDNTVTITSDAQKDFTVALTRYKKLIESVSFEPTRNSRVWVLNTPAHLKKEMAFLQNKPDPNNVVINEVNITKAPEDSKTDYLSIAASPTADVLVYQKVDPTPLGGSDSHLYKRDIKSGTETKLTSTRAQEFTPAFTYGGDFVVFSSDSASENPTLWKIKADGKSTLITHLTTTDSADYGPSVGQTLIVYTCVPPNALKPEIWRCSLAGVEAGLLSEGTCPQLSPDERQILFLHEDRDGINLWLMDKDGGNLRQVTQSNGFAITDPRWSPDGKWIAYASTEGTTTEALEQDRQPSSHIWVVSSDGSNKRIQLTHSGSCDTSPAWDRSGAGIYFRSNRGGSWNIWKLGIRPNVLE